MSLVFEWLFLGKTKHRWQHGVICILWATLAFLWYFYPSSTSSMQTRIFWLMFSAWGLGVQGTKYFDFRAEPESEDGKK